MNILDIGANIGYYVLIQRNLVGKNAKITAIEPIPENVNILRKNLKLNKSIYSFICSFPKYVNAF